MSILQDTFKLSNNKEINKIGIGTWQVDPEDAYRSVKFALNNGYLHVDTAVSYRNQHRVGDAVKDSDIDREEVFITTKIPGEVKSYEEAKNAINQSLKELKVDYIDLMLIHAPRPWSEMRVDEIKNHYYEENKEVWRAMEEAYEEEKLKSIGVSNFSIDDLEHLLETVNIVPHVNQVKYHIGDTKDELHKYYKQHEILIEGYSPLATGGLLGDENIKKIGDKHGKTVPQVSIRYLLEKNILPLPKSVHEEYILQNAEVDFKLDKEDMDYLDSL